MAPVTEGLAILAGLYLVAAGFLYFGQRGLLYQPSAEVPQPAAWDVPEMEVRRIATGDGFKLLAWWRPPEGDRPTLIMFHGNAGHLGDRAEKAKSFLAQGYGVLMLSYRYNAGAGGRPSEPALHADGLAGWRFVQEQGIPTARVVLYGESLGSGVAVKLAAERPVGAVVLEAPYSSIAEVAQFHYWYVPARWLIKDRFDSVARIGKVTAPLLIFHGERDRIIPPRFARKLCDAANHQKECRFHPGAAHNDLYAFGAADWVTDFIKRYLGSTSAGELG